MFYFNSIGFVSRSEEAVRRLREEKRALESEKDDMELSLKAELRQLQEKYSGAQAEVDTLARFITELNEEKQQAVSPLFL